MKRLVFQWLANMNKLIDRCWLFRRAGQTNHRASNGESHFSRGLSASAVWKGKVTLRAEGLIGLDSLFLSYQEERKEVITKITNNMKI